MPEVDVNEDLGVEVINGEKFVVAYFFRVECVTLQVVRVSRSGEFLSE